MWDPEKVIIFFARYARVFIGLLHFIHSFVICQGKCNTSGVTDDTASDPVSDFSLIAEAKTLETFVKSDFCRKSLRNIDIILFKKARKWGCDKKSWIFFRSLRSRLIGPFAFHSQFFISQNKCYTSGVIAWSSLISLWSPQLKRLKRL